MGDLLVCGMCGDDQNDKKGSEIDLQKVILEGYANILCRVCRMALEDEVANIAKRYLWC